MSEWQPIETAPILPFNEEKWFMSHSPYLLLWDGRCTIGVFGYTKRGKSRWQDFRSNINPTHWMPLPEPPQ